MFNMFWFVHEPGLIRTPFQMWYINDVTDVNMGYAMNKDSSSSCAEEIANTWQWYDWEGTGDWVMDTTATLTCIYKK